MVVSSDCRDGVIEVEGVTERIIVLERQVQGAKFKRAKKRASSRPGRDVLLFPEDIALACMCFAHTVVAFRALSQRQPR